MPGVERRHRFRRQDGQALVEYGLLIAAGAVTVIVGMLFLAGRIDDRFSDTGNAAAPFKPPLVSCDASYAGACVPPAPPDLDCPDLEALGIPLPVNVVGGDAIRTASTKTATASAAEDLRARKAAEREIHPERSHQHHEDGARLLRCRCRAFRRVVF